MRWLVRKAIPLFAGRFLQIIDHALGREVSAAFYLNGHKFVRLNDEVNLSRGCVVAIMSLP